jgi:hypothetical protein
MMKLSCINMTGAAFRRLKSIVRRAHVHRERMEQEDSAENTSKIWRHTLVRLYSALSIHRGNLTTNVVLIPRFSNWTNHSFALPLSISNHPWSSSFWYLVPFSQYIESPSPPLRGSHPFFTKSPFACLKVAPVATLKEVMSGKLAYCNTVSYSLFGNPN